MSEMDMNYYEIPEDGQDDGFVIDNDQKAEWAMKKIREAQEEKEKWKAYYDEQLQKVNAQSDRTIEFMQLHLERYFRTVPHKVSKTQESYALPSGKLVWKEQQPEYERDDEALIPWLIENNLDSQYIQIKESVNWAELKKMFKDRMFGVIDGRFVTEDGEFVPGITVTERPDVFKVEVK